MKIKLTCPECISLAIKNAKDGDLPDFGPFYLHEINDENIYRLTCAKGHETAVFHQALRFEILIDFGLWALNYELQDSAYLKFFSALEYFRLFFIRSWLHSQLKNQDDVRGIVNSIKRSEPQNGAFTLLLELLKYKYPDSSPQCPNFNKLTEMRNKVAHNGYIPTTETAMKHCQEIMDFIVDTMIWCRTFMNEAMQEASFAVYKEYHEILLETGFKGRNGTIGAPTAVHFAATDIKRKTIEEAMQIVLTKSIYVGPVK